MTLTDLALIAFPLLVFPGAWLGNVSDPLLLGAIPLSYLAGSIPFGLLIGRAWGVDVRTAGSGNVGATNVARTVGKPQGLLVFVLDLLKGYIPVLLVRLWVAWSAPAVWERYDLPVLCALAAVLGHTFPVWIGFRGGKGGATGLGVGLALAPRTTLIAFGVWVVIVLVTRYVSLGTILASLAFVVAYLVEASLDGNPLDRAHMAMTLFSVAVASLVVVRHKSNIRRLVAGTENKF